MEAGSCHICSAKIAYKPAMPNNRAPPCGLPRAPTGNAGGTSIPLCELNAVKQSWSGNTFYRAFEACSPGWHGQGCGTPVCWSDVNNRVRWTEMHPIEFMALLPDKPPQETVRMVAVLAENGRTGNTTTFEKTFEPPTDRVQGQSLKSRRFLTPKSAWCQRTCCRGTQRKTIRESGGAWRR
jgi:hypothetical protein